MPISAASIRARGLKTWRARAWVAGAPVTLTELPTRTLSLLQARATAGIAVRDVPAQLVGGQGVVIDISLDGVWQRYFTGETDQFSAAAARVTREINASQAVSFDRSLTSAITWNNRPWADAVQDLLGAAGVDAGSVDGVYDPGSSYALGATETITLAIGESLSGLWSELMEFGGTALVVLPSGRVRVVNNLRLPASTSQIVYAEAASSTEYGLADIQRTIEPRKPLLRVFTATGPKLRGGATPNGTYTATGIAGQASSRQYRFLQDNTLAQTIAEREVQRRAREQATAEMEAPLNPNLWPGDTILIRSRLIGLSGSIPAYVEEVRDDGTGGMRASLSLNASQLIGYASSVQPPIADFAMVVDYQMVVLSGTMQMAYLVQCQDQSHDPLGYELTTWAWAAGGQGAAPTSASGQLAVFIFTDLAGAEIELTVDSDSGQSATITRSVRGLGVTTLSRVVTVAAGADGWRVLDGSFGWREWTRSGQDCTAVPTFNERGPLLSGWDDGRIYASSDYLVSTPTLVADLGADPISALFVNEADSYDILAGHGQTLSRSQDGGVTWRAIWTGDDTVADCQSSPARPDEIRLLAGSIEYLTLDGGATWAMAITGPETGTGTMIATAPWGHAATFDGVSASADAMRFEEGDAVLWELLDGADRPVAGLASVTPLLNREGWIVGETADLIRDGVMDSVAYTAGTGRLWLLLPSGSDWAPTLLAAEGPADGAGKALNDGATSYGIDPPADAISAAQIGYGPLMDRSYETICLVATGDFYTTHSPGSPPTPGGVYYRNPAGDWSLTNAGLPDGWDWQHILLNRHDPADWVVYGVEAGVVFSGSNPVVSSPGGESVVWRTADAGQSWHAITVYSNQGTGTGSEYLRWAMVNASGRTKADVDQDPMASFSESPGPGEDFPARMAVATFADGAGFRTTALGVSVSFTAPGEGP